MICKAHSQLPRIYNGPKSAWEGVQRVHQVIRQAGYRILFDSDWIDVAIAPYELHTMYEYANSYIIEYSIYAFFIVQDFVHEARHMNLSSGKRILVMRSSLYGGVYKLSRRHLLPATSLD